MTGAEARAWGDQHLHRAMWTGIPAEPVPLVSLIPTQWPHYDPCQRCTLRLGRPVHGGDPYPHLVEVAGQRFVWDGHTRIAHALRHGHATMQARVLRPPYGM